MNMLGRMLKDAAKLLDSKKVPTGWHWVYINGKFYREWVE